MFILELRGHTCTGIMPNIGFGTLIRAMGTQANKGARKGACRDLSGRRMRDVDAEKKYETLSTFIWVYLAT